MPTGLNTDGEGSIAWIHTHAQGLIAFLPANKIPVLPNPETALLKPDLYYTCVFSTGLQLLEGCCASRISCPQPGLESYEVVAEEVTYTASCHPSNVKVHCEPAYKGALIGADIVLGPHWKEWLKACGFPSKMGSNHATELISISFQV